MNKLQAFMRNEAVPLAEQYFRLGGMNSAEIEADRAWLLYNRTAMGPDYTAMELALVEREFKAAWREKYGAKP